MIIGRIILIEHCGKPTVWPVERLGDDDSEHLKRTFEKAKEFCSYEIGLGGTLKLFDSANSLVEEYRGV